MKQTDDSWREASSYESFMGRWSRLLAVKYVRWIDAPIGSQWLDVGCGTGSLARVICEIADPVSVTACDPAEAFVEFARNEIHDRRISFQIDGVGNLPRTAEGYDVVASLLALNFFPDPLEGLREMASLTRDRGVVSACVWDYAEGMEFLRVFWDAALSLDPAAAALDEGRRFPICSKQRLEDLFLDAGLSDIVCELIEITTSFSSFDDYWRPFLGGTGPAPAYIASLESVDRERLMNRINDQINTADNLPKPLKAAAWAIRGRVL